MAVNKKPKRNVASRKEVPATLMGNQDTVGKGDSRAERTARTSFSTTPAIFDALTEEAYKRRMSRSQLIEDAIVEYLGL